MFIPKFLSTFAPAMLKSVLQKDSKQQRKGSQKAERWH